MIRPTPAIARLKGTVVAASNVGNLPPEDAKFLRHLGLTMARLEVVT